MFSVLHQALSTVVMQKRTSIFLQILLNHKSKKSPSSAHQASTILHVTQKAENIEEKVDEIEIEADCSQDVLIGGEAAIDEVCVIDDIPTEQQSASNGINEAHSRVERDKHANKAGHNCQIFRSGVQRTKEMTLPNARRPPKSHGAIPEKSYYKRG
jgi:hypothetical protein